MAFSELTLDELVDRVAKKEDFTLIIEETRNSILDLNPKPEAIIRALVKKINTFDPCSQDIVYFLNDNKPLSKIELGLITEDKPNLMYWEKGKPKFSFYVEDAIEIFK